MRLARKERILYEGNVQEVRLFKILIATCLCLFAGRAFQHLFQDIPIRTVLWNQRLMEGVVTHILGMSWDSYVTDPSWDGRIQLPVRILGGLYVVCITVCILLLSGKRKNLGAWLITGSVGLFLLAYLYFAEKFFRLGELMEYTAQWASPIFLYLFVYRRATLPVLRLCMCLAVSLTFAGHGLYAIGFYPVPGHFIDMMIMTLHVQESTAVILLNVAGWIDLVIAVLIFIPYTSRYVALYAFVWGLLTALARVWSNFDTGLVADSLYQWIPEVLYRAPHALIPLAVYYMSSKLAAKTSAPAEPLPVNA